jgi:hypothetical protein
MMEQTPERNEIYRRAEEANRKLRDLFLPPVIVLDPSQYEVAERNG